MSVPAESIDRARQVGILPTAQRFVILKHVAANEWAGPCPSCGGDDRFAVNTRKQVFNCRGCGASGGVIDLVMLALGVGFADAVAGLAGASPNLGTPRRPKAAPREAETDEEEATRKNHLALAIFDGARSIRGSLAETYLVAVRGVDIDQIPDLDSVLRFEPRCPFGAERLPALIALVRDIVTNERVAIQRTAIDSDGRKIDRWGLGPKKGGAIRLWPTAGILVVGEGLETVASAATRIPYRGAPLQPAWALIDRANLSNFPILANVERLIILVDHDANGHGQAAAAVCAKRWSAAGREVIRLTPDASGTDFNDLTLHRRGAR
jgi:phage/plasmid primase-like uncharacterized protein